jgi:REP element-mobilizing transposase RayT
MARQPRIDLAGFRNISFSAPTIARRASLRTRPTSVPPWLDEAAQYYGGSIHAYVLVNNHVHLWATGAETGALGRMMQSLGRRHVRYFNSKYRRSSASYRVPRIS